jgi:hypothetical protein
VSECVCAHVMCKEACVCVHKVWGVCEMGACMCDVGKVSACMCDVGADSNYEEESKDV